MNYVNGKARDIFLKDYETTLKECGILKPSVNKDPVYPPWSLVEYEAMEKDTAKYLLFYAAIRASLEKLNNSLDHGCILKCMVIGAGRGRLVDYCLDCLNELNMCGLVYVIECNVQANEFLCERYQTRNSVKILSPFVVRTLEELLLGLELNLCDKEVKKLIELKPIKLFVSELLGSFADNEFVSEVLSTCMKAFGGEKCISIPCYYTTYLTAVYSPTLDEYFKRKHPQNMYILGLPDDSVLLTEVKKLYVSSCAEKQNEINITITLGLLQRTPTAKLTGLAGCFRANLIDDLIIDTTPTSSRNTFFWETAFFPVDFNLDPCSDHTNIKSLTVNFIRKSEISKVNLQNIFRINCPLISVSYVWKVQADSSLLQSEGKHTIAL